MWMPYMMGSFRTVFQPLLLSFLHDETFRVWIEWRWLTMRGKGRKCFGDFWTVNPSFLATATYHAAIIPFTPFLFCSFLVSYRREAFEKGIRGKTKLQGNFPFRMYKKCILPFPFVSREGCSAQVSFTLGLLFLCPLKTWYLIFDPIKKSSFYSPLELYLRRKRKPQELNNFTLGFGGSLIIKSWTSFFLSLLSDKRYYIFVLM